MLVDSHHKKWILVTFFTGAAALTAYTVIYVNSPGGLSGGSIVGMWYGVIGTGLMVYAGLLSALRRAPGWWWLGARKTWLRGHIWLGSLSFIFILCHSGFRWGGPIELALWIVLVATLATGIYGLVLQQFLPRLITARITSEAPYDQIPRISGKMVQNADAMVEHWKSKKELSPQAPHLERFYMEVVRPFLDGNAKSDPRLRNAIGAEAVFSQSGLMTAAPDEMRSLQLFCNERAQLLEQERLHYWLHGWLFLHVPLAIALLVLGVAHIIMSLYY